MRITVLASGSGSLLGAILDDGIAIEVVVVDRPSKAQGVAESHGVEAVLVERTSFGSTSTADTYTDEVVAVLQRRAVDLIVMAGFGTVLGRVRARGLPRTGSSTPIPRCCPPSRAGTACEDAASPTA